MDCNGCTVCCEVFPVPELDKPACVDCKFCEVGRGCSQHAERPEVCRNFDCAYRQMENVSEDMRPDKLGIIFEKIDDQTFLGTANPKHKNLPWPIINGQIHALMHEGFDVVLVHPEKKPMAFSVIGHEKALLARVQEYARRREHDAA